MNIILALRLNLTFEIGDEYIQIVQNNKFAKSDNELNDISYMVGKPMILSEMIYLLRMAGILLTPSVHDMKYVGYRKKVRFY